MLTENRLIQFIRKRDWRIWFGLVVTFVWIFAGIWFVMAAIKSDPDHALTLETVGSFLEGAFAPMAFLWLVLGLFIQQRELARNADALLRSTEQVEKQTLAIAATEMNARQETFFKIAENVKHQLGGITGLLYVSALGPAGSGRMSREQMDEYFRQSASGDSEIFARQLLSMDFLEEGGISELLYGSEIRRRHSRNFRRSFERLVTLAEDCDVDGIIVGSMMNTAFGLLYSRMEGHVPANMPDDVHESDPSVA
jgi:hypothetical protein